jgi:hypothetical protein
LKKAQDAGASIPDDLELVSRKLKERYPESTFEMTTPENINDLDAFLEKRRAVKEEI